MIIIIVVVLLNNYKFRKNLHMEGRTFFWIELRLVYMCPVAPCDIVKVKNALVGFVYTVTECTIAMLLHVPQCNIPPKSHFLKNSRHFGGLLSEWRSEMEIGGRVGRPGLKFISWVFFKHALDNS